MSAPTLARVQHVMALAFNVPAEQVGADAAIGETPGWDSLGHANLMLALEEEFGVTLTPEAQLELQSLPEIVAFLEQVDAGR